ncbi:MAG: ATP:cob(I)alamin adenosyltransferase [Candidatus Vogelbacteria bacterium RIFOXYD1_FULL_44_32]|uniref:Corrinoid adenosyltransferase n=1 Tax=Candidatus Vogelbacteria bacterium RIFOXYD1_FULL_44_32 TaxID=1802438 RepID=A0A1G2QEE8_9BACT|nr:MAG: ATP:cob(I)alamin adenosyltransferase [Candidatus Vogelbacteria bacterium RIFOXYD1_FULL_44_32]
MALFTGKGDNGTTKTFGCDQRVSKSSTIAEALGTLDEINSFLGICKEKSRSGFSIPPDNIPVHELVHQTQQNLFIVQAELAGADKHINREKVIETETTINEIEKLLPPITTFFISGGTELAAHFDFARTLARRAERRVVAVQEEGFRPIADDTRAYLNRLSSLLYALARLTNHMSGITEEPPQYK